MTTVTDYPTEVQLDALFACTADDLEVLPETETFYQHRRQRRFARAFADLRQRNAELEAEIAELRKRAATQHKAGER